MTTKHSSRMMKRTVLVMALLLMPAAAAAQSTESLAVPVGTAQGDKPAAPAEVDYVVPDLKTKPNGGMHQVNDFFSFKPSLALLEDFTYIDQDADSIAQVGDQASQWQVRSARLTFLGSIGKDYKVSYQFGGEYKGFDTDPVQSWQLTDLSFTFPIGGPNNKLTVGKTKETFNYEMVGDAANLPHSERVLSPFFVSRNMGVKMLHVFGEKKTMTLSYGVFNDTWDINSTSSRGMDYTARVTGLVWDVPEKQQFLHLGLALREVGADGTLRYRGRPESNVTDYYVDTGNMPADGAFQYGLEALWNSGPFSVLAEYNHATIDSPTLNDPEFKGYYITGSWVITGETRPYDRNVGYARRVIPTGRWGAPELVVRYSNLDLDDNTVQGGAFEKTYLGLNWWATKRWKFGIGWGRTWLDKNGVTGVTDAVLSRIQWVY